MLRHLAPFDDPNILLGPSTADDVGAYRLDDDTALVMTTDFFAPVVDDPYWFGAIAAANSFSDVYAKGVWPALAMNLVGFPAKRLPLEVLEQILQGGAGKAREAGVAIIGGHSVDDVEPKYGLAVVGICHPDEIITNATARVGDRLVLTKPLGVGIITTGIKRGLVSEATEREVTELMARLNRAAAKAMIEVGVHAATDVTGYGLLGHLREILSASGVAARVDASNVPVLSPTRGLVAQGAVPGGSRKNLQFLQAYISWDGSVSEAEQIILCDAQTSGGLLISVAAEKTDQLIEKLQSYSTLASAVIGEIIQGPPGYIQVMS